MSSVDFGRKREVEERELLHEMLGFIQDEVDELGTHRELLHEMLGFIQDEVDE